MTFVNRQVAGLGKQRELRVSVRLQASPPYDLFHMKPDQTMQILDTWNKYRNTPGSLHVLISLGQQEDLWLVFHVIKQVLNH